MRTPYAHLRKDTLLVCPDDGSDSNTIQLIALSTGKALGRFTPPRSSGEPWAGNYRCALSPDGRRVFLACRRFRTRGLSAVHEVATGRRLFDFPRSHHVERAAWSPRGDRIAIVRWSEEPQYDEHLAEEYDAGTGERIHEAYLNSVHGLSNSVYSPDGALRVVNGRSASFYDRDGELLVTLHVKDKTFLWATPPDEFGSGWFFTNRPHLVTVVEVTGNRPPRPLPTDDPRRLEHVQSHNLSKAVAARLAGLKSYREFMHRYRFPPALPASPLHLLPP